MKPTFLSKWLPTPGSIVFTLLIAAILVYTSRANALSENHVIQTPSTPASTTTFPYQGRLNASDSNPITATLPMTFRLYTTSGGGTDLWAESWPGVEVTDGLFNVLLGTTTPLTPTLFTENSTLWLGIQVAADAEMTPRVQFGSVPYAAYASSVHETNVIANVHSVRDTTGTLFSTNTGNYVDLVSIPISVSQASTLRISFRSLVWKTVSPGRTALGIRIDGNPNEAPLEGSLVQVGTPVTSGDWWSDSQFLSDTFFVNVPAGEHTVTLALGSYDNGTSHATLYGMNIEILKQP